MAVGCLLQYRHNQLLVISGQIGRFEERSDLELTGGYLVVAGLRRNSQFEEFTIHFIHEGHDALRNEPEVMILKFLAFGCRGTHESTTGRE